MDQGFYFFYPDEVKQSSQFSTDGLKIRDFSGKSAWNM
jgi:hypothetical protein